MSGRAQAAYDMALLWQFANVKPEEVAGGTRARQVTLVTTLKDTPFSIGAGIGMPAAQPDISRPQHFP